MRSSRSAAAMGEPAATTPEGGQSAGSRSMIDQLDGPGRVFFTQNEALFFQGFEVAHNPIGGFDAEAFADFPDGR